MWVQGGFRPDDFWHQTPLHFQLAMKGVGKRLETEYEGRQLQAYQAGAFAGLAHHGKLKRFDHYRPRKMQTAEDVVSMLQAMGAKSDMKIRKIERAND